jgi:putative nucleotidyltransferase with HDIG domain
VVVSDMRMPRLDGTALLMKVKQLQPRAVRIVLSGQTEPESAMKAVFVAHRFLAKPCDPQLLRNVIDRACHLNEMLASSELRAAVGQIGALPPVPGTYLALCQVLARPSAAMKDLLPVIEGDIGLCAKVLQVVNSAFFGLPRRISSLLEAVNYLGTSTIKNLAVAVEALRGDSLRGDISPLELQRHSLLTAQMARRMMAADPVRADQAFLAGILHDIGRLLLPRGGASAGMDHALLGAYLLDLWGLPQAVVEAVAHHSRPAELEHLGFDVVDAVYVADRLAATEIGNCDEAPLDLTYLAERGVPPGRLEEWRTLAQKMAGATAEAA